MKVAEYEYRDLEGVVMYRVERYEQKELKKKNFYQSRPNGRGGWIYNMRGIRRIPYRLPELIAAPKQDLVVIVEGEKKVEALRTWGIVATCNAGGAEKWNNEFSTYFRGRRVVILPDNDPIDQQTGRRTGMVHATKVFASLKEVAESVRILELPGLPEKGDIVDWQADGHTLAEFLELVTKVESAEPEGPVIDEAAVAELDPLSIQLIQGRTDDAAAKRFILAHGTNARYCSSMKKWFVWTGKRWTIDQAQSIPRWVRGCTDKLWESVEQINKDVGADLLNKMKNWCKYADSAQGIKNCIDVARSNTEVQLFPEHLDSNPWLLNCKNGTVDLKTGELTEHRREDMQTKITRVAYDPDAECPVWERFILSVFGGNKDLVAYVQRLCGYWATGVIREQILPILWGSGSNGKTTFLNAIMDVLGRDYSMKAAQDFLMAKHGDSHPTEKADLFGKRIVFCSETEEGRRLSESLVKELTGTERIRARRMREDFWEFEATHKVALVTNHKPVVTGGDHGIWRRIRLIEFGVQFWDPHKGESGPPELRQDGELRERLMCEYPGILRWIIQGCQAWQVDGEMVPEFIKKQTEEYKGSQDIISQWMDECCDIRATASEKASDLYKSFRKYCESAGEYVISQKRFGGSLGDRGFKKYEGKSFIYQGIELLNSEQESDDWGLR
ncbi:MAG: phage/plasmid primase, P4 family [Planctomycetaceae bacterium]